MNEFVQFILTLGPNTQVRIDSGFVLGVGLKIAGLCSHRRIPSGSWVGSLLYTQVCKMVSTRLGVAVCCFLWFLFGNIMACCCAGIPENHEPFSRAGGLETDHKIDLDLSWSWPLFSLNIVLVLV